MNISEGYTPSNSCNNIVVSYTGIYSHVVIIMLSRWACTRAVSPAVFGYSSCMGVKMGLPRHSTYRCHSTKYLIYIIEHTQKKNFTLNKGLLA